MCYVPQRYEFHNRGRDSDAHWVTGENQKHAEWKKAANEHVVRGFIL